MFHNIFLSTLVAVPGISGSEKELKITKHTGSDIEHTFNLKEILAFNSVCGFMENSGVFAGKNQYSYISYNDDKTKRIEYLYDKNRGIIYVVIIDTQKDDIREIAKTSKTGKIENGEISPIDCGGNFDKKAIQGGYNKLIQETIKSLQKTK